MTARQPAKPGQHVRTRDWFLLGMLAGLVYSLWKNPQGCACATGCLGILIIVAIVLMSSVIYAFWSWIPPVIGLVILIWWLRKRDRERSGRS